jgi:hypothetical protein
MGFKVVTSRKGTRVYHVGHIKTSTVAIGLLGTLIEAGVKYCFDTTDEKAQYKPLDEHNYKFNLDKIDYELHRKHSVEDFHKQENDIQKQTLIELWLGVKVMFWFLVLMATLITPVALFFWLLLL